MRKQLLTFALLTLTAAPAGAQQWTADELISARSLYCEFPTAVNAEWSRNSEPELSTTTGEDFSLRFILIDLEAGSAQFVGSIGDTRVAAIKGGLEALGEAAITFVEVTPAGFVNVTSVFAASGSRTFKAVHSRHIHVVQAPVVSQSYGYCRPMP